MAIKLTPKEMELVKEGKLDIAGIDEYRKVNPVRTIDVNELEKIKEDIRQASALYKDSIQKNKDLYNMLIENRKLKEQMRNKLAELRLKKKQILGLVE